MKGRSSTLSCGRADAAASIVLIAAALGCSTAPRPEVTINPEDRRYIARVSARIVPNQFPVDDVILEFGRRPNTSSAVAILYNSTPSSYDLHRDLSRELPTTEAFDVTFLVSGPQVGEVIDYQFKVTHRNAEGAAVFFWSPRRSFQVQAAQAGPVPPPPGSGGGASEACPQPPTLVSVPGAGIGSAAGVVSGNGAFVVFVTTAALNSSDVNGVADVYRLEVSTGNLTRVTGLASASIDAGGGEPSISNDGRFVAFTSRSTFDSDDTNGVDDVYRRDLTASNAAAFMRVSGLASVSDDLGGRQATISADGRFVAFTTRSNFSANDTNTADDVYRRDMNAENAAAFVRVSGLASASTDLGGHQPAISGDGRFVAFTTRSAFDANDTNDLDDVYRRDLNSSNDAAFTRVSGLASLSSDLGGSQSDISSDGRFVAFTSRSPFTAGDTNEIDDVYRRDLSGSGAGSFVRVTGLTSLSNDRGGTQPAISSDGRFVAFTSTANFDPDDTNAVGDVYRRDLNASDAAAFVRISGLASVPDDLGGTQASVSNDGAAVAFVSRANFVSADTDGIEDVYLRVCP